MESKYLMLSVMALLLSGCANSSTTPKHIGMPNPASAYCKQLGGVTIIKKTAQGDIGYCQFSDETEIEEWTLFRRDHPKPETSR